MGFILLVEWSINIKNPSESKFTGIACDDHDEPRKIFSIVFPFANSSISLSR